MRHPSDGTLRRLLDEPAGVTDADREHVTGCPACRSGLTAARQDAAITSAALSVGFDTRWHRPSNATTGVAPSVEFALDVDTGWHHQSNAAASAGSSFEVAVDAGGHRQSNAATGAASSLEVAVEVDTGWQPQPNVVPGEALSVEFDVDVDAGWHRQSNTAASVGSSVEFDVDVEAGWQRLSNAVAAEEGRGSATAVSRWRSAAPGRRWRAVLRSPVVAVVGVVVLLAGAGAAVAGDWLQILRTEQIAPVVAPQADLVKLPDLSAFGKLEITEKLGVREVADVGAAEKASGLSVPWVSKLPHGVTGEPTYHVAARISAVFTFSAEKAAQTAAAAGQTPPPPPPGLDGSQFRLVAGPGVASVWSKARGIPAMIVVRAAAPTVYSSGIPFDTARDYLLSLPSLSEEVASQLRAFSGDGTTLPVVVSVERLASSTADVGGVPATVLTSRNGVMAGVVWVDDGIVTAVAGSLSADEVLSVARGLRWDR
ncbi:hypothetical protein Acor_60370 [Acrocarpospora corrugata]|uniref:DUF4367 domain-containing protein n=1 Tax=Acrocarpospora corrugata TaxID=35763 RepID=A0A5M3WA92_9ACTN|nr:hypothetical protein [Acrocarpospora corrugata]GES03971.1 hypothetical protein Acor_60370 [Acrocarpospora corrugata]